jgi:hypothetical protein
MKKMYEDMDSCSEGGYVASRKKVCPEVKDDPTYREKRERNNEAVKKSREKKRRESEETSKHVALLTKDNKQLKHQHLLIKNKYETIKELYEENFGPLDRETEDSLFRKDSPPLRNN